MQLKKLHLSGFKSFADDTTLEFGAGITAVVGPNGSGKSNIVDALLWCLGERSHKALRGSHASDVIFSGAAHRKATGRAEVNLFFSNENGVLPIDFKEVQVTRKLFRDGNGEYGLCGSKCRLRDVLDLFLDTGVGPDAYCIISQGEIDAILSAKPEDRRGLIEGAAGIQKYHARRNETKKRLEKVEADLTRVADITSELASQLAPLEAQALLARDYESLAARLKALQLGVLARDYATRVARLSELQERQKNGSKATRDGKIAIENAERLESITSRKLREIETHVEGLGAELTRVVAELGGAQGEIAVARERRRALGETQEFAARELGALRARLANLEENRAAARAGLDESQRASGALSGEAALAEAKLGAASQAVSVAARALQELQARAMELMRAGQKRRENAAGSRAQTGALTARVGELARLLETLESELAGAQTAETAAKTSLESLKTALQNAAQRAEDARGSWQNAGNAAKIAVETHNRAREARSGASSRLAALRELEENLEGLQGGARGVLQAVKRGDLRDDYTPIADAIRAPREFELAIEVALGGNVNNLICPDESAAKIAVDFLKRRQAGRATFLPLSILEASFLNDKTLRVLEDASVRGLASELVECDAKFDNAIGYLLNRFIVVETLDDAIRLAKRCESGARLVTLDGELVLPAGAITGGAGKSKSSGLLARKRELDELAARLTELEAEIAHKNAAIVAANEAATRAQEAWRASQNDESEARSHLARAEREAEHCGREVRRVAHQRETVAAQKTRIEADLARQNLGHSDEESAAAVLETQAHALDEEVARAQNDVAAAQKTRENVAEEVAEVRASFALTQSRLNEMKRAIADWERQIGETQSQIRAKTAQIERAASEDENLGAGEGAKIARLSELEARRGALESALESARAQRTEALTQTQSLAVELKTLRETLHASEDETHRVEVRIASTEAEMRDLERRFGDEFALEIAAALEHKDDFPDRRAALDEIETLSAQIGELGTINLGAVAQYDAVKERLDFLTSQKDDLEAAKAELDAIMAEIDGRMRAQFLTTFAAIQSAFDSIFIKVFSGGKTALALTNPENLLETGIDLRVQMPGKAAQDIGLLSGGERALTALSFMMAILRVRPSPFVVLDEVDAPLDQSNVGRFTDLLREFTDSTQFIVITHNNGTMQAADVLYGVTQQEPGISTLMSVRLAEEREMVFN